jgi:uncharacterized protein YegL
MSYSLLDQAEFADNPEPRCPVVLLLDTSGSMEGEPINELNQGLQTFAKSIQADALASLRVEVAILTFGGDVRALDVRNGRATPVSFDANQVFTTVDLFQPPTLQPGGDTPMGEAIERGLDLLRDRKEIYKQNGLDYFRPWMFLITDGQPTDSWQSAASRIQAEEGRKGVLFFAVGVEGANMQTLFQFTAKREALKLKGLAFAELFQWLSASLSTVAHSKPGEQAALPPVGWAAADSGR